MHVLPNMLAEIYLLPPFIIKPQITRVTRAVDAAFYVLLPVLLRIEQQFEFGIHEI